MKRQLSILLSMCLILESIFSSATFAQKNDSADSKTKNSITQQNNNQEKSEIKEIIAYLSGVLGCAAATIIYAYNKFIKTAPLPKAAPLLQIKAKAPSRPKVEATPNPKPEILPSSKAESTSCQEVKQPKKVINPPTEKAKKIEANEANKTSFTEKTELPQNLKAIHWQNNLCWFNATILMFYYHKDFHDCIISFPIDEGLGILHEDIGSKAKNQLEAFMELAKTFRGIDHCNRIYRLPDRKLYNSLDSVIEFRCHTEKGGSQKVNYGSFGMPFQIDLYNMIADVFIFTSNFIDNNKGRFPKITAWISQLSDNINPQNRECHKWSLNELFRQAGILQIFERNHYWIRFKNGESRYDIGKILSDSSAIALVKS